jgi:hypothetical protein
MFDLKRTICALLVLATLASAVAAQAATYYVATTGSNSNTCAQAQNPSTPKQTISAGISCLAGSDTLIVKAGTYPGQTIQNVPPGSAGAYTIVKGDSAGARPKITLVNFGDRGVFLRNAVAHHIEIRHFEFDGVHDGMKLDSDLVDFPHHIRFIDNVVHDTVNVGILVAASSDQSGGDHYFAENEFYRIGIGNPGYAPGMNTIYNAGNRSIVEGNILHNNCNGISVWTGGPSVFDVIIRKNVLYDMARSNIDTWQVGSSCGATIRVSISGGRHQIYNNVIYRSNFYGILVQAAPNDVQIYNNTIYNLLNSSEGVYVQTTATNVQVKNNIAYLTGGFFGGTQSNNLTTNPLFVDAANGNFHLQNGSPAIDAGIALSGITVDIAGILKPQGLAYDIGAYEYSLVLAPPLNLRVQ